jgi:hypothetical protein
MKPLKPLEKVYWLRLALGIFAAVLCTTYGVATGSITNIVSDFRITTLFNSTSVALITYMISYYIIKAKFVTQVQKPQKLVTTGIGVYLLSWLVFWVLLYTVLAGSPP